MPSESLSSLGVDLEWMKSDLSFKRFEAAYKLKCNSKWSREKNIKEETFMGDKTQTRLDFCQ